MNKTMMIDLYEFTMGQMYFDQGKKDQIFYFDIFYRTNPFSGGYAVMGGLDNIVKYVNEFKFDENEIAYLRSLNQFSEDFLSYLGSVRFDGDIWAVPDGTPIFPGEPIVTVRCKAVVAQLLETALLACFNHGTLVTTAAKRITNEAKGIPVMEFGARRARGIDSAIDASRYAYIGGCCGTSNVYTGMETGIPVLGTMAHSLIMEADDEYTAFLEYAKSNPNNCVFLVDTYDTLKSGIPNAIKVSDEYLKPNGIKFKGIRIDSGDLAYLSKEARKMLDAAGYPDATICLSNGLNEFTIASLLEQGAKVNSFGVGDNIAASKERMGGVYKLVAIEKDGEIIPKIKVSNEITKITNPAYKKAYRFYDKETGFALGDVVTLYDEVIPMDGYTLISPISPWKKTRLKNYTVKELQVKIFENGKQVYTVPTVAESKKYCDEQMATIYPETMRLHNPNEHYVDLSEKLLALKNKMLDEHGNQY